MSRTKMGLSGLECVSARQATKVYSGREPTLQTFGFWPVHLCGLCVSQDLAPIRLQKRTPPQTRVLPKVPG